MLWIWYDSRLVSLEFFHRVVYASNKHAFGQPCVRPSIRKSSTTPHYTMQRIQLTDSQAMNVFRRPQYCKVSFKVCGIINMKVVWGIATNLHEKRETCSKSVRAFALRQMTTLIVEYRN